MYFLGLSKANCWSNCFSNDINVWHTDLGVVRGGQATETLPGILQGQNHLHNNTKMLSFS